MEEVAIPYSTTAIDSAFGAEAVAKLRTAALADPEGSALEEAFKRLKASSVTAAE